MMLRTWTASVAYARFSKAPARQSLFARQALFILFITVDASVDFFLRVCQPEYMRQFLFDRSDAARILAFDDICDFLRKGDLGLLDYLVIFYYVDRNVIVDEAEEVEIQRFVGLDLDDILLAHLVAGSIFNDSDLTVELIEFQVPVDIHTLTGLDVVDNITFADTANI